MSILIDRKRFFTSLGLGAASFSLALAAALSIHSRLANESDMNARHPSAEEAETLLDRPDFLTSEEELSAGHLLLQNYAPSDNGRLRTVFTEFNHRNDPYGFKRLMFMLQALGSEARVGDKVVVSRDQIIGLLTQLTGNDMARDPLLLSVFNQLQNMRLEHGNDGTIAAFITTVSRGGARAMDGSDQLNIKNGTRVVLKVMTGGQVASFLNQPDGGLSGLASADAGARSFLNARDQVMSRMKADLPAYFANRSSLTHLSPLGISMDGISATSEGRTFQVVAGLVLPGFMLKTKGSWMSSYQSPTIYRASYKKGPLTLATMMVPSS